ncbi:hypothetical protein Tco_0294118 [Tanacetum coccineum]
MKSNLVCLHYEKMEEIRDDRDGGDVIAREKREERKVKIFVARRKRTSSRRVIKKKVTISADDNIIPEPDVALELGKSISLTEAAEEEAARQVHATHARIVTESVPEPTTHARILKGVQTLTPEEQLAANTMKALKKSKKTNRRQLGAGGSSEGTGVSSEVPDESIVILSTSSEGTGTKPGVPDEEKVTSEANVILDWGSKQESEYFEEEDDDENIDWTNNKQTDDEFVHCEENVQGDDEETDDELVHADEQVNEDEDEEMKNAKDVDTGNGDEEITDTTKVDAEKIEVEKDDIKKVELPPTSSSLSVSSGFGNKFLNLSPNTFLIGIVKDTTNAEINSLLDPSVLTLIPETPSVALATTLLPPPSISTKLHVLLQTKTPIPTPPITTEAPPAITIPDPLLAIIQRVSVLEKDVQELKEADNNTTLRASLKSEIHLAVNAFLGSSLGDALQKVLQKHMEELIQKYPQQVNYKEMIEESVQANIINEVKNQLPKFLPKVVSDFATLVIQSTVKNALEKTPLPIAQSCSQAPSSLKAVESLSEYELKMILFDKMDKIRSYLTHDKHQDLFDALLNSILLDDAIARARPNQGKKTKRSRTKESEPLKKSSTFEESSKGKSPAKTSKFGKSVTAEKPVKEPAFEMTSDDIEQTIDDVANDVDQPPNDSTQTKDKDPKKVWFKQPPRPPTPDQE